MKQRTERIVFVVLMVAATILAINCTPKDEHAVDNREEKQDSETIKLDTIYPAEDASD